MSRTQDHTQLVADTRLELGREPDFTIWSNSKVTFTRGKRVAKPGLQVGASDLIGILSPQGRLVALEAKTGDAVPSREQRLFMALVRRRGGFAAVFRTKEEARAALERARRGEFE